MALSESINSALTGRVPLSEWIGQTITGELPYMQLSACRWSAHCVVITPRLLREHEVCGNFFHETLALCSIGPHSWFHFVGSINQAITSGTEKLKRVIDDTLKNLDFGTLIQTTLKKALDYRTYVDVAPSPRVGETGTFTPGSPTSEDEDFQPALQRPLSTVDYVANVLFEINEQYPDELKIACYVLMLGSCAFATFLLILQDWETKW
jgi:hypothetical protein